MNTKKKIYETFLTENIFQIFILIPCFILFIVNIFRVLSLYNTRFSKTLFKYVDTRLCYCWSSKPVTTVDNSTVCLLLLRFPMSNQSKWRRLVSVLVNTIQHNFLSHLQRHVFSIYFPLSVASSIMMRVICLVNNYCCHGYDLHQYVCCTNILFLIFCLVLLCRQFRLFCQKQCFSKKNMSLTSP